MLDPYDNELKECLECGVIMHHDKDYCSKECFKQSQI